MAIAANAVAADLSESIQSGNGISLQRQDDVPITQSKILFLPAAALFVTAVRHRTVTVSSHD